MALTLRQHRYRAGSGGVFVVTENDPQVAVKRDQGLVLTVVDMDRTGVATPGRGCRSRRKRRRSARR